MKKTLTEQLEKKKAIWTQRTANALGMTEEDVQELLGKSRRQSLRLNNLRASYEETLNDLDILGGRGMQFDWIEEGYSIETPIEVVRDSKIISEGKAFIQNAASWLPVLALRPNPGETILDVCAAPGGKTSHIAALTGNKAHIYANDNSRPRLAKLQGTIERLGVQVDRYSLFDATQLATKYSGHQFDKILLDAPCSGEGLMSLDNDKGFESWSVAHIKRLQRLQKRILTQAWQLLRPGGVLVYSTCTMAPEENEAVVDYMLRTRRDTVVEPFTVNVPNKVATVGEWNGKQYSKDVSKCLRLAPSEDIEAFFVCKLKKVDGLQNDML